MDCVKAVLNDAAIALLELKAKQRVAQGFDTLLLSDVNEVLTVANKERVKTKEEKEEECSVEPNPEYYGWPKYKPGSFVTYLGDTKCKIVAVKDYDFERRQYLYTIQTVYGKVETVPEGALEDK